MITFKRQLAADQLASGSTLADYLRRHLGDNIINQRLSQVVTELNEQFPVKFAQSPSLEDNDGSRVGPGFPWITPVLGSGTVAHGLVDEGLRLRARLRAVESVFDDERLPDGVRKSELVSRFAVALVRERVDERWEPATDAGPVEGGALLEPTARLLLGAALLTQLHDGVRASTMAPVPRWEDGAMRIDETSGRYPGLKTARLLPTSTVLSELLALHDPAAPIENQLSKGVVELVEARLKEVRAGMVPSLVDLRLFSDCAWYYLQYGCLTYPGWSDLMLELAMRHEPIRHQNGRARPLYDRVARDEELVRDQYREAAAASWTGRAGDGATEPTIHDVVAQVLVKQAGLHGRNTGPAAVPRASAFVTGFDLELEFALWRLGRPFVVAVPVVAARGPADDEASILWIGHYVEPSTRAPEEVPDLGSARCYVLSGGAHNLSRLGSRDADSADLECVPIVVRLTGCPALAPPALAEADEAFRAEVADVLGWESVPRAATLESLFVLDEHVAGVLGTAELFLDHLEDKKLGLPKGVAGVPGGVNARFARYWLVTGAQLGDSSIRQRIVSHLAATALSAPEPLAKPRKAGLVVNTRVGLLDSRLLQWRGFDVVEGSCQELVPHLEHYARHLDEPNRRCDPNYRCEL